MLNAFRPRLLQNGSCVFAMTDKPIPFDRHPFARIAGSVQSKPLLFALASAERHGGAQFVRHGHHKMLLFREWERFERAKDAGLVHDFQLPDHSLIVPWPRREPQRQSKF